MQREVALVNLREIALADWAAIIDDVRADGGQCFSQSRGIRPERKLGDFGIRISHALASHGDLLIQWRQLCFIGTMRVRPRASIRQAFRHESLRDLQARGDRTRFGRQR